MKKSVAVSIIFLLILGTLFASENKKIEYNENHPIIIDNELLGGFKNGKWITKNDFIMKHKGKIIKISEINGDRLENINIPLAKDGDMYKVYHYNKYIGIKRGNNPNFTVDGYANEIMEMSFKNYKGSYDGLTSICGDWNGIPRKVRVVKENEEYIVDIDGDGKEEKILIEDAKWKEKTYDDEEYEAKGKKIIIYKNGKRITVTKFTIDDVYNYVYDIRIIDLNGDGIMEIIYVLSGHNTTYGVYEIKNWKPKEVLHNYIGD